MLLPDPIGTPVSVNQAPVIRSRPIDKIGNSLVPLDTMLGRYIAMIAGRPLLRLLLAVIDSGVNAPCLDSYLLVLLTRIFLPRDPVFSIIDIEPRKYRLSGHSVLSNLSSACAPALRAVSSRSPTRVTDSIVFLVPCLAS